MSVGERARVFRLAVQFTTLPAFGRPVKEPLQSFGEAGLPVTVWSEEKYQISIKTYAVDSCAEAAKITDRQAQQLHLHNLPMLVPKLTLVGSQHQGR